MQKKVKWFGFAVALLVSFAVLATAGLPTANSTIELEKEQKAALANKGITAPAVGETFCDADKCTVSIYQLRAIDGNVIFANTAANAAEYKADRDTAIQEKLEKIANAEIDRAARTTQAKLGGGTITISEKK